MMNAKGSTETKRCSLQKCFEYLAPGAGYTPSAARQAHLKGLQRQELLSAGMSDLILQTSLFRSDNCHDDKTVFYLKAKSN
jgi:hypothetical protein